VFAGLALIALLVSLVYVQLTPRFLIGRHGHYGWPFVHAVRHVYTHVNDPTEIYYVPFVPGLIGDLLAWSIFVGCSASVLRRCAQAGALWMQVSLGSLLWLTTVSAVVMAICHAEPRDFWIKNRILDVPPGMTPVMLLFALGCVVHTAMRMPFVLRLRPLQVLVKKLKRAHAVDRVRPVEELDLCSVGNLQVSV
jgi:hypothetical protein